MDERLGWSQARPSHPAAACACCLVRPKKRGKNRSLRPWNRRYVTSVYTHLHPWPARLPIHPAQINPAPPLFAPTGALYVMWCAIVDQASFSDFENLCNWCHKSHSKSPKQYQCNWCHIWNWLRYWAWPFGWIFCLPAPPATNWRGPRTTKTTKAKLCTSFTLRPF